jgi:hypothetical protein
MRESPLETLEYAAASVLLRAPRVAVVVPQHDRWPELVALVLARNASIWGGADFALVPHRAGEVAPHWLQLMSGFDPDHVVTATMPLPDLMPYYPGESVLVDKEPISPERARELGIDTETPLSGSDERARLTVAAACTPFRRTRDHGADNPRTRYEKHRLPGKGEHDLVVISDPAPISTLLDFRSEGTRLAAAWLASLLSPIDEVDASSEEDLPERLGVQGHVDRVRAAVESPGPLSWAKAPLWQPSLQGLTSLLAWQIADTFWIVIGDTLDDFALGHTLSRATHGAVWLPNSWLEPESPFASAARDVLAHVRSAGLQTELQVVSASVDVAAACERLERAYGIYLEPRESWLEPKNLADLGPSITGTVLALERDYDRDLLLPVTRDSQGDRTLVDRLPALVPETPVVAENPSLDWIVDVALLGDSVPRGRGLPPDCLQGGSNRWRERIRSGRDGLAIMSSSLGFVPSGATLRQRIARPTPTFPSPRTWLAELAAEAGLSVSTSEPGHVAEIASRLWLGRSEMAADLSAYRPLFAEFLSDVTRTSDRYPDHDGVVLRREGYLTWKAIARVLGPGMDAGSARTLIDRLVEQTTLTRGFIVACPKCGQGQFQVPDHQDFSASCARCRARIPLLARTWRAPVEEPNWYYDLHPVVRRLMKDHGDVPLLAEHHLGKAIRHGVGTPEFEIRQDGMTAEIDLLYLSPGRVLIGETKKAPTIPRNELTKKVKALVLAAEYVQADEIVLAAGELGDWEPRVVSRCVAEICATSWSTGKPPSLRLISGLRSGSRAERVVISEPPA